MHLLAPLVNMVMVKFGNKCVLSECRSAFILDRFLLIQHISFNFCKQNKGRQCI